MGAESSEHMTHSCFSLEMFPQFLDFKTPSLGLNHVVSRLWSYIDPFAEPATTFRS